MILSRKGPLFVKEPQPPNKKATFAPLPNTVSFETATLQDAIQSFQDVASAKLGESIGMLDAEDIRKKKGPYGFYVEWKGTRVPIKEEDTLEQIQEKLQAKQSFQTTEVAFSRQLGEFTIKKGP